MKQTSLESTFEVEKNTTTTVKYKMTVPLKKCKKCKEWKPKSDFYKAKKGKGGLMSICRLCRLEDCKVYTDEHKEQRSNYAIIYHDEHKDLLREKKFLFARGNVTNTGYSWMSGYLYGTGICIICGEIYPRVSVNHHVVPWDDGLVISLGANCHEKHRANNKYRHMASVMNAIENSNFLWKE